MEKQNAIAALAALAQETRLDVFRLLVRAGPEGLAVGEIGKTLGLASPTLSFHLKELTSAGLLRCERAGRSRIYRPDFGTMNRLVAYLGENCCQGLEPTARLQRGSEAVSGKHPRPMRRKDKGG